MSSWCAFQLDLFSKRSNRFLGPYCKSRSLVFSDSWPMFAVEKTRSVTTSSTVRYQLVRGILKSLRVKLLVERITILFFGAPEFCQIGFVLALQRGTVRKLAIGIQIQLWCNQGFLDFLSFPPFVVRQEGA